MSWGPHKISPESSDGFASVGTILPKEEVALLPGDLFVFLPMSFAGMRDVTVEWLEQADVAQLVEQLIRNQ